MKARGERSGWGSRETETNGRGVNKGKSLNNKIVTASVHRMKKRTTRGERPDFQKEARFNRRKREDGEENNIPPQL